MTKNLIVLAFVFSGVSANASFLDGLNSNIKICRDTFVSMMNESTAGAGIQLKKQLTGVDKKTGAACVMNIKYNETAQRQGRISVDVPNSGFVPFNHEVYTSNEACNGDQNFVKGRYSFRQETGWHKRFTTKIAIERLGNGQLAFSYAEEGSYTLTCIGSVK